MKELIRDTAPAILVIMCGVFLVGMLLSLHQTAGWDFSVYWRVANEPVSLAYEHRKSLNFPYPPTMLLWVSPLGLISQWVGYFLWQAISVVVLVMALRPYLSRFAIGIVLISPPVVYCLLMGQVSMVLAAAMIWALSSPSVLRGVLIGLVATIKPQLVAVAPIYLIARKDWVALLSCAASFLSVVGLSFAVFGVGAWQQWFGALDHFHDIVVRNGVLSVAVTPAAVAESVGLPANRIWAIGAVAGCALAVICRGRSPLSKVAVIATGSLMASPYAIVYDLTPLAPFLVLSALSGSALSMAALASALNPLPLVLAAFVLIRDQLVDQHDNPVRAGPGGVAATATAATAISATVTTVRRG